MSDTKKHESGTGGQAEPAPKATAPESAPEATEADGLDEASKARFVQDLLERGEVVPKGEDLPAGATHELEEVDGQQILHRRRFSTY